MAWFDPASHILTVVEGLFLKAMPLAAVGPLLWPVALVGAGAALLALVLIDRQLRHGD